MSLSVTLAVAILCAESACSTTGQLSQSDIKAPPIVQPPAAVNPEIAGYVHRFFVPLATRGFRLGATANPDALRFNVSFDPNVFHTQVVVDLQQRGATFL
jgi:hypothetical protein